jgi:hypothetical protein
MTRQSLFLGCPVLQDDSSGSPCLLLGLLGSGPQPLALQEEQVVARVQHQWDTGTHGDYNIVAAPLSSINAQKNKNQLYLAGTSMAEASCPSPHTARAECNYAC